MHTFCCYFSLIWLFSSKIYTIRGRFFFSKTFWVFFQFSCYVDLPLSELNLPLHCFFFLRVKRFSFTNSFEAYFNSCSFLPDMVLKILKFVLPFFLVNNDISLVYNSNINLRIFALGRISCIDAILLFCSIQDHIVSKIVKSLCFLIV